MRGWRQTRTRKFPSPFLICESLFHAAHYFVANLASKESFHVTAFRKRDAYFLFGAAAADRQSHDLIR